ncbi:MAG: hypothetical protein MZU97_17320 [Bacillus subtilis]|nr:hypothetical protein [Bacillus subtilis]
MLAGRGVGRRLRHRGVRHRGVSLAMTSLDPDASLGEMIPRSDSRNRRIARFSGFVHGLDSVLDFQSADQSRHDEGDCDRIHLSAPSASRKQFGFSPLLTNIVMGTAMVNLDRHASPHLQSRQRIHHRRSSSCSSRSPARVCIWTSSPRSAGWASPTSSPEASANGSAPRSARSS